MAGGRPRKPASLKKGKSETKAQLEERAAIEKQFMSDGDKVKNVPEFLDPMSKMFYKYMVNELEISGLLTNLDMPMMVELSQCLTGLRETQADMNARGRIIRGVDGKGNPFEKDNPSFKQNQSYFNQLKYLANQFGMSPAARAQLAALQIQKSEEDADPLLKILRGDDED